VRDTQPFSKEAMHIRSFKEKDRKAVIKIWEECNLISPQNDPNKDIDRNLEEDTDLFLIGCQGTEIIASAMGGYDGHRGWVYYLAVKKTYQKNGLGKQLMQALEKKLLEKGCPKINLMVRESNTKVKEFYRSLGFQLDSVVCLGKRLIDDE